MRVGARKLARNMFEGAGWVDTSDAMSTVHDWSSCARLRSILAAALLYCHVVANKCDVGEILAAITSFNILPDTMLFC